MDKFIQEKLKKNFILYKKNEMSSDELIDDIKKLIIREVEEFVDSSKNYSDNPTIDQHLDIWKGWRELDDWENNPLI